MTEKKNGWKDCWKYTVRCLRDVERCVPGRLTALLPVSLVVALTPYVTIWFSAQLVNELAGGRRPEMLWRWTALTLGVSGLLGLLKAGLMRWMNTLNSMHNPMKERLFLEKMLSMDFADADSQRVRQLRTKIRENEKWSGFGINEAVQSTFRLVQAVLGILGAAVLTVSLFTARVTQGGMLFLNNPLSALVLLSVMGGIVVLQQRVAAVGNRLYAQRSEEATFGNRLFNVFFDLPRERKRWMDLRLYGQYPLMREKKERENPFAPGKDLDRIFRGAYGVGNAVTQSSGALFSGLVYVFACLKALGGAFGVGSVTQYVGAATALSSNLSELLGALEMMRQNTEFLRTTYEFLDIPNAMYQGSLTTEKRSDRNYQVEFRDVSFKYPGAETWALRHVNFTFDIGKRMAVVGENGSGKTTFIKLLCRLYDPQEGEILLNGIDIRKYNYRDYLDLFSVVFQDFQLLAQPLGANVAGRSQYDRRRVEQCLTDAGFADRLAAMPKGLDTELYKDLDKDGVEISGGEAQKIAIARALYKDAPFLVLDEPTAALDPIAEAEIYEKFNSIVGDKTAVYISHRLSSCKFCDQITVFDHGSVIQQGSHEALLADTDGEYARLWQAQAQYYTK